jgi:hypothetical protein
MLVATQGKPLAMDPNEVMSPVGQPTRPKSRARAIPVVVVALVAFAVVAASVVLLVGQAPAREYPADTPEGTIQRYVRALDDRDLDTAYGLLSAARRTSLSRADFADMAGAYGQPYDQGSGRIVRIAATTITGDRAVIELAIEQFWGGGFSSNRIVLQRIVDLVREEGGWRLRDALVGPELYPALK